MSLKIEEVIGNKLSQVNIGKWNESTIPETESGENISISHSENTNDDGLSSAISEESPGTTNGETKIMEKIKEKDDEIRELEKQLNEAKEENGELKKKLKEKEAEVDKLKKQMNDEICKLEKQMKEKGDEICKLEKQMKEKEDKIRELAKQLNEAKEENGELKKQLNELITKNTRDMNRLGLTNNPVEIHINKEDLNTIVPSGRCRQFNLPFQFEWKGQITLDHLEVTLYVYAGFNEYRFEQGGISGTIEIEINNVKKQPKPFVIDKPITGPYDVFPFRFSKLKDETDYVIKCHIKLD